MSRDITTDLSQQDLQFFISLDYDGCGDVFSQQENTPPYVIREVAAWLKKCYPNQKEKILEYLQTQLQHYRADLSLEEVENIKRALANRNIDYFGDLQPLLAAIAKESLNNQREEFIQLIQRYTAASVFTTLISGSNRQDDDIDDFNARYKQNGLCREQYPLLAAQQGWHHDPYRTGEFGFKLNLLKAQIEYIERKINSNTQATIVFFDDQLPEIIEAFDGIDPAELPSNISVRFVHTDRTTPFEFKSEEYGFISSTMKCRPESEETEARKGLYTEHYQSARAITFFGMKNNLVGQAARPETPDGYFSDVLPSSSLESSSSFS